MTAEDIKNVNETLKTIDIRGKGYVQVPERVKAFRSICPNGSIQTEIVNLENGTVTMKSSVMDENGKILGTGFAQEKEGSTNINKTSFIENCETSAVGRALGWCGIGIDASMASAEEVANAILNQGKEEKKPEEPKQETDPKKTRVTENQVGKLIKKLEADAIPVGVITELYKVKKLPELSVFKLQNIYENWDKIKAKAEEK